MSKPKVWSITVRGTRVLVCETSERAAVELLAKAVLYTPLHYFREDAEPGNAAECRLATEPGVWQELASGWRRVI